MQLATPTTPLKNRDPSDVIQRHSRSFSLASRLLPARCRTSVHALYAWCRTVDDVVDDAVQQATHNTTHNTPQPATPEHLLQLLEEDLDRLRQGLAAEHPASAWIAPLVVGERINVRHAKELITGMRMDLQGFRVESEADLQLYCYHAAGTVGLMLTSLFGVQQPQAERHAIALGVAMQLTNIARDVREDAERGRSYLPGIREPLDADPQEVQAGVARVLETAEREYRLAGEGLKYLPSDCRLAVRLALALYREIGRQIQRNGCRVLHGRTILSKPRVAYTMARTLLRTN